MSNTSYEAGGLQEQASSEQIRMEAAEVNAKQNIEQISFDALDSAILNSTCKQIGISLPANLCADTIALRKAAKLAIELAAEKNAREKESQNTSSVANEASKKANIAGVESAEAINTADETSNPANAADEASNPASTPSEASPASTPALVSLVCATKAHASALNTQAQAIPEVKTLLDSQKLRIVFAGDIALEVLSNKDVQHAIKRDCRVLDANEIDVLVEDIKVTGLKVKRLSEMLKFFYRSLSDCTVEKEGWLISPEESGVFAVLEENLEARRALLPYEIYAKAYQGMKEAKLAPKPQAFIVDDFGALSVSAQRLIKHLATDGLVAFGNTAFLCIDDEPYPAPRGMQEFLDDPETYSLSVLAEAAKEEPVYTAQTPHEEFEYVAGAIAEKIKAGGNPESIVVAAPNATWLKYLESALKRCNVKTFIDSQDKKIKGDPRNEETCGAIKLAAFAKLLKDPHDFTAYRTFLGAGEWLLRSDGFLELLAFAREHDLPASEAISLFCKPEHLENATVSFRKFLKPIQEYEELCHIWESENNEAIVSAMQAHGMPLGNRAQLIGDAHARPDIEAFIKSFKAQEPKIAQDAVVLTVYTRCHGHMCDTLFITGMVDGFMPKRDAIDDAFSIDHRAHALERDKKMFESIKAIACKTIIYSNFDHDLIENTGALHLVTTRIYHKDGKRLAQVSASALLE